MNKKINCDVKDCIYNVYQNPSACGRASIVINNGKCITYVKKED